ncbi:uncharacterized protein BXIN_1494 [Babesia sp. Xinjiang]|uniref:uncharacterized protein n=1 Tax=Babesia sp. Xinjiang TaxID=462227 RepID=UPI000A23505A|nr:uncharacterized protein BXIN_1494 [Babesia sp. Xinjiang]ORM42255.1 hypothetical protein BXIN_1494 [Babesia sp. Xinjiang]
MTTDNNGPVARMIKLPQGHYRRVGRSDAPDFLKDIDIGEHIFDDIKACCENTCFVNDDDYAKLKPNSEIYTDACSVKLEELTGADDLHLFYQVYSKRCAESLRDAAVQTTFEADRVDVAVGRSHDDMQEQLDVDEEKAGDQKDAQNVDASEGTGEQAQMTDGQEKQNAMTEKLNQLDSSMLTDPQNPDIFKNKGVPTLFYTKMRVNPTLVVITIDYELQVIYMTRNDINRFFPIKLISRLVSNPEIIKEEFEKHIEADKDIKLENTIVLNAANFTDSVAIQFPDPILKDMFGCADLEAFVVSKYDPLLTIVKELNENLQHLERENLRLERRIINLEQHIAGTQEGAAKDAKEFRPPEFIHTLEEESALSPPWLFSCQIGTAISTLQVLLEFSPANTMELDVSTWSREENMWIAFMEEIPTIGNITVDVKEMVNLSAMRRIARRVLMELSQKEAMVVLRNVPGKDEATTNATSITLVAILASAMAEAWKRVEYTTPQNMGRVCLILEGENIGSRLRAGTKKFRIEPLN